MGLNSLAWLALLVWIGIPILAGWMFTVLPKRAKTTIQRKLAIAASIGVLIAPWLVSSGVKWYYDQQVRELCAKDGGVKVYETVKLSPEKYDDLKRVNFILPDKSRLKPADEYYLESEDQFLKEGNPNLLRNHAWVIRRSDGKILGESIQYGRGGGELPGPWHGSSFFCPEISKENPSLEPSVFIKGDE